MLSELYLDLCMSSVFSRLLDKPLFRKLEAFVLSKSEEEKIKAYSSLVSEVYESRLSFTDYVIKLVFEDENVYVKSRARGDTVAPSLLLSLERELQTLERLAGLTPSDFSEEMNGRWVSPFDSYKPSLTSLYEERMKNVKKYGYGIFSSHSMFRVSDNGEILPIISADKTTLESFIGYADEREKIIENTKAFVEGRPALNTLLYGDAGTGKSSTVKAIVNSFYSMGLRLIELRKDQLSYLPSVMGKISDNPLKFIIFIDDLSFNRSDDNFSMLKAALEGSASAKADNAVIYATSNRRHIIKESFSDREGSDVHVNDTLQETLSLSERFGLVVLFSKPNKALYLEIVNELAVRNGITLDKAELERSAEEFALRRGNRSARCAEQFIESLM